MSYDSVSFNIPYRSRQFDSFVTICNTLRIIIVFHYLNDAQNNINIIARKHYLFINTNILKCISLIEPI